MTPPALQRLTKRAHFLYVRAGLRSGRGAVMIEARRRSEGGAIGMGLTASRKVGNAVARNRARRRLREAAKRLLPELGLAGVDYVLVARQSTPEAEWAALLDDVGSALIRLRADLTTGASPRRPAPAAKRAGKRRGRPTESD